MVDDEVNAPRGLLKTSLAGRAKGDEPGRTTFGSVGNGKGVGADDTSGRVGCGELSVGTGLLVCCASEVSVGGTPLPANGEVGCFAGCAKGPVFQSEVAGCLVTGGAEVDCPLVENAELLVEADCFAGSVTTGVVLGSGVIGAGTLGVDAGLNAPPNDTAGF